MNISDRLSLSFRNLLRRKSRTILTILSVLIGTVSIIMLLSLAIAMNKEQKDMISSFADIKNIEITSPGMGNKINKSTYTKLKRLKHVNFVIPHKDFYLEVKLKNNKKISLQSNSGIKLIPDDVFKKISPKMLAKGKNLNPSSDLSLLIGSKVVLSKYEKNGEYFDQVPVENLDILSQKYTLTLGFEEDENPTEEISEQSKPKTSDVDLKVLGILGESAFLDQNAIYINEKTYNSLVKEDEKLESPSLDTDISNNGKKELYHSISVICDKYENVREVEDEIKTMGYETNSYTEMIDEINKSSKNIMFILGGIGSIAFIVSAIGIINTMLMSIYERQKEIGIMKVIGASIFDIKSMFLIEAGFIGFLGGLFGLISSLIITFIINHFLSNIGLGEQAQSFKLIIPLWLCLLGVSFSSIIGVLAGYLPAIKATKLSAIETLRSN